jgi:hypothetical protein
MTRVRWAPSATIATLGALAGAAAGTALAPIAVAGAPTLRTAPAPASPGCRTVEHCIAAAPSSAVFVATRPGRGIDATLRLAADGTVSLVQIAGRTQWRIVAKSALQPRLAASGDLDGDHVTDFVLWLVNPTVPPSVCGGSPMRVSSLLVVDGRTGATASPFPSLPDVCWDTTTFNYPTLQWDFGSVYVGDFSARHRGAEVVLVPYYAQEGTVWNFREHRHWETVRTRAATSFQYPSTPAFDRSYDASNPTGCSHPVPGGPCYVQFSHVANGVFLGAGRGFFVLTSSRAVVYRPNLTPTSDTTWFPGSLPANGGRNYGLVETYRRASGTYVDLIGGCSVRSTADAMRPAAAPTGGDDNCGIVRHYERFRLSGTRIVRHRSIYFGYASIDGALDRRVEYPARPRAALGGARTSWTAFNLLHGGTWSAQVYRGTVSTRPLVLPGWFVWDTLDTTRGAVLLATRVASGQTIPSFAVGVLRWDGHRFRSIKHVKGVRPALVRFAQTSTRHTLESDVFGVFARRRHGGGTRLLVEERSGRRRFVTLATR